MRHNLSSRQVHSARGHAHPSVCRGNFNKGHTERLKFPLHNGAYKLREAQRGLDRCLETVATLDAIATDRKAGPNGQTRLLGCCTSDDAVKSHPNLSPLSL